MNADLMRMRAFIPAVHGFLDTIRDGHPDAPLLVISPIWCAIHEDTPGTGAPDLSDGQVRFVAMGDPADVASGKLALGAIRAELPSRSPTAVRCTGRRCPHAEPVSDIPRRRPGIGRPA